MGIGPPTVQAGRTDPSPPAARSLPYSAGLDGLRTVAVVAVLLYHLDLLWIPGGFLGVEVFFIISGFLITSLLRQEWERAGRICVTRFWFRRARRLLPALFATLIATTLYAAAFLPRELAGLRGDLAAAFTYVTNWYLILQRESYFEAMGRPSLLKHLWSLAVEEQFYIVWPLVFAAGMRLLRRAGFLGLVGTGIAVSTAMMWVLYDPGQDPSRVYYGTDTRAAGLLIGAALAFVWQPWHAAAAVGRLRRWLLDLVGLGALGGVIGWFLLVDEYGAFLYRGGFLLLGLTTAALIAAVVHPASRVGRLLGIAPLRWLGLRSYAIYLWHWPIFMVTRPWVDVTLDGPVLMLVRLVATVAVADLSYRLVELPFRQGALGRFLAAARTRAGLTGTARRAAGEALAALPVALVAAVCVVLFRVTAPVMGSAATDAPAVLAAEAAAQATALARQQVAQGARAQPTPSPRLASARRGTLGASVATPTRSWRRPPGRRATPEMPYWEMTPLPDFGTVTFLGDSVMLGAATALRDRLGPSAYVDAAVSRQYWTVIETVQQLRAAGLLGDVVVVHLGNNGTLSDEQFAALMAELRDVPRVFFVTVRVPRHWEAAVNKALASGVRRWPNARLIDWRAASNNRPELFREDGVHLLPEGIDFYADVIIDSL